MVSKKTKKVSNFPIKGYSGSQKVTIKEMNKVMETRKKEINDLKSRSKSLSELIFSEKFKVCGVSCETYSTSVTTQIIAGGRSPSYGAGFTSRLLLKVEPYDKNINVKEIVFDGYCPVLAGSDISALIPKYNKKMLNINPVMDRLCGFGDENKVFYLDRDYKEKENAIQINILSKKEDILGLYKGVNFRDFAEE
jgi:hypothetical protein